MGLRWSKHVADLDHTNLRDLEHVVRGRSKSINNYVFERASQQVDKFLDIERHNKEHLRPDLYRQQDRPSPYHPGGYIHPDAGNDPTGRNDYRRDTRPDEYQHEHPFDDVRRMPRGESRQGFEAIDPNSLPSEQSFEQRYQKEQSGASYQPQQSGRYSQPASLSGRNSGYSTMQRDEKRRIALPPPNPNRRQPVFEQPSQNRGATRYPPQAPRSSNIRQMNNEEPQRGYNPQAIRQRTPQSQTASPRQTQLGSRDNRQPIRQTSHEVQQPQQPKVEQPKPAKRSLFKRMFGRK